MMRHLSPEHLLDIAEGVHPASAFAHVQACEVCRRQIAELRTTLADAAAVEIPEPSPLFWDHLSANVRDAVAAEAVASTSGNVLWASWRLTTLVSAAALVLAVGLVLRVGPGVGPGAETPAVEAGAVDPAGGDQVVVADDPSFSLLVDLSSELDWDAAEAGIVMHAGTADRAWTELTSGERVEMRRLLQEEMAGSGV